MHFSLKALLIGGVALLAACDGGSHFDEDAGGTTGAEALEGVWDLTLPINGVDDVAYFVFDDDDVVYDVNYRGDAHDNGDSCYRVEFGRYRVDGDTLILSGTQDERRFLWDITSSGALSLSEGNVTARFPRASNGLNSIEDMQPRCDTRS